MRGIRCQTLYHTKIPDQTLLSVLVAVLAEITSEPIRLTTITSEQLELQSIFRL